MWQLKPTQETDVNKVSLALSKGLSPIVLQEPTGTGKTVMFSAISQRYVLRNDKSVLILVHRKKLLRQTRRTLFDGFDISAQIIVAGMRHVPFSRVYVGMIESTKKRLPKDIGLVIIDEAHYDLFNKILPLFPDSLIIGFTATPICANKKRPMKTFYKDIVCGPQIKELIKLGYLCQNITYSPRDIVERASLSIRGGEFNEQEMASAYSKPKYINNTVTAYEKYTPGTKALIFNVNIDHCKQVDAAFKIAGYDSKVFDSTMSETEQNNILNWFHNTPLAILNSINILTAGFDDDTIETVIFNRATKSLSLWIQCTGRGSRPNKFKSMFTVIDMGGNALTHGDWNSDRDWHHVFHNPPSSSKKEQAAPCKSCPQCDAILPASVRLCSFCGYEFPSKKEGLEGELSDFIIVTKGIDVRAILNANRDKKELFTFFSIGKKLADQAKKTTDTMNDEKALIILSAYENLVEKWCNETKTYFSLWHREKAKEHLFTLLKERFKWEEKPTYKIEPIHNLQMLQMIG